MAPPDRDVVLARRALFVSAALVGIHSGAGAAADDACAPEEPPDALALSEARKLFEGGHDAQGAADFEKAKDLFKKAYELTGNVRLLYNLGLVHVELQEFAEAARYFERVLQCGGDKVAALAKEQLATAERQLGRIVLENLPDGARVQLDGQVHDAVDAPVRVNPGTRRVVVTTQDGRRGEYSIQVEAGETVSLNLENILPPDCDANPALCMPCLSLAPPPRPVRSLHFGIETGYAGWIKLARDESSNRLGHGVRLIPYLAMPLADDDGPGVALRLGGVVAPTWTPDGNFIPLGGDIQLSLGSENFSAGFGLAGGYTLTEAEPAVRDVFVPAKGLFLEPYVQVIAVRLLEPLSVGLRVGNHFSNQRSTQKKDFGLGHVNVGVWLSFALTPDCEDFDEYGPCPPRGIFSSEEEENVAQRPNFGRW